MTLQDILNAKGSAVHTISPDNTLADVVEKLVEHRIGSLVVCERDEAGAQRLLGIITDRDLLYVHASRHHPSSPAKTAAGACPWLSCKVSELVSRDLITVSPGDSVEQVMGLMTAKRIRHLPVLSEGRLVGIVSIGDVVKAHIDHLAVENRYMKDYIRG